MKTLLRPRYLLLLLALVAFGYLATDFVAPKTKAAKVQADVTVRAAGRGRPFLNLRDGYALKGTDAADAKLAVPAADGDTRPLALAAGDFDIDGAPDLLSGYAAGEQGFITLRRGNMDAFAPRDPTVFQAIQQGQMPASFLSATRTFAVPEAPDFLVAGDFNRDGLKDVLSAARGGGLYLLAGDGAGNFAPAAQVKLVGGVTALAVGSFDRGDGLSDVVVGINGAAGPEALIYMNAAGGLRAKPSRYALPAPATSFALGEFDKDSYFDVAATTGREVSIIHAPGGADKAAGGKLVAARADGQTRIEHVALPFEASALAAGYFVWNRDQRKTLAVLAADGAIHLLQPADLDRQPYTPAELAAQSSGDQEVLRVTQHWDARPLPAVWQPGADAGWTLGAQLGTSAPPVDGATNTLAASFISYQPTADLLVVNAAHSQVNILRHLDEQADAAQAGRALPPRRNFRSRSTWRASPWRSLRCRAR